MRQLGIAVSYIVSLLYVLLIVWPALYCIRHSCSGSDLDGFMPAFLFTPVGGIATAFALRDATRQIRRGSSWSGLFWFLAAIFVIVLAAIAVLAAIVIFVTAFHRR